MKTQQPGQPGLRIYNTLARQQEPFVSREPGRVKMFTCGPSIYSRPHLGNYRTFLMEDVLQRYLEYAGYRVERVINFTDVEDKAVEAARRQGVSLAELTRPNAQRFREEAGLLRLKLPEAIPRSSTSVEEAVEIIQVLLEKGYAYWHRGDVFFDPLKFQGFGKLYGLDMSRWPRQKRRYRKDTYPGQRWNLGDFILWHGCGEQEDCFAWQTAIGRGRPAWNVQDPAMILQQLGTQIDISCGGVDNLFRHHDYNIAVMECFSGREFARYWLHADHVLVRGVKMSKSRGNVIYLEQLSKQGFRPAHLRFFLLRTHYRSKLHFSLEGVEQAQRDLAQLEKLVREVLAGGAGPAAAGGGEEPHLAVRQAVTERLEDDLDVGGAVQALIRQLGRWHGQRGGQRLSRPQLSRLRETLAGLNTVLQILPDVQQG